MPAHVPLPIGLEPADGASSAVAGRVVFVVDPDQVGTAAVMAALRSLPGVVVPDGPSDLFDGGVNPVIGNYLSAVHVGGGVAGLADGRSLLLALQGLADAVYASVLDRSGAEVVVDASASSAQVVTALYPDATLILIDDGTEETAVVSPTVCRVSPADLDDHAQTLATRLAAAIAAGRPSTPRASDATQHLAGPDRPPLEGRAIFIVGCPRSGTTWLEHLLGAHPAIGGPGGETAIFESLGALWDNAARPAREGLAGWIDREDLIAAMRRCCETLFGACLSSQSGATWFLEKTPGHGWRLDLIAAVYPDAWVISIHRDGRDVARSLLEVAFGLPDLAAAATMWAQLTGRIEETGLACPRFRDVRYELLLADPVGCATDLLTWMGLPVDAGLDVALTASAGERVSRYNTSGEVGAGKWSGLSRAEVRTIYRHAGDRLVAMGYLTEADLAAIRARPAYVIDGLRDRLGRRFTSTAPR